MTTSASADNGSPTPPPEHVERIHVICMQHLDVAWLWPRVPHGEDLMRQCFERAIAIIDTHPDETFIFSRSTAWSFQLIERQAPALFERVTQHVRSGRIALCGGQWVEPDHVIPSGESLVRQAALAQWYFLDRFGKTARVCWAVDNFAHAGSLPQILRKAGMDGYYLSRCLPQGEDGQPHMQFRWQGLEGSEVMAFRLQNMNELTEDSVRRLVGEHAKAGLPAILVKANDMYSDRRVTISNESLPLPSLIAANPDLPDCRWSSPDELAADMQSYRHRLPLVQGELGFEYTGTYTTDGRYKRRIRRLENLLPNAEKASCWGALHGYPYPAAQLKQAWEDLCLNQFHDINCGSCFGYVLEEADRLNTEIENRADWALGQALAFLCDQLHAEQATEAPGMAIFGFTSFDYTAPVLLPNPDETPATYVDESGAPLSSQTITRAGDQRADMILHANKGMDAQIIRRLPGKPALTEPPIAKAYTLENDVIRVELDPETGDFVRLLDKQQGKEYLPEGRRGNCLEFLAEDNLSLHPEWCTMEPWWIMYTGEQIVPDQQITVTLLDTGPLRGCFRVERRMQLHADMPATVIVQDIALYRHSPLLHIETRGDWHAEHLMLKARFDLPFKATRVDADTPYGVAERRLPQHLDNNVSQTIGIGEEWKADEDPPPEPDRCMQTWLDISNDTHGLLILNNGKYGYDADETQVGISLMRAPNMRPWQNDILGLGPFAFSYAIMPHAGNWRTVNAPRHGHAFNNPPAVRPLRSGVHDLAGCQWWDVRKQVTAPITRQFLTLQDESVEVTAVKQAEDGDGLILRLVEHLGEAQEVSVKLAKSIVSAEICDLLERPIDQQHHHLTVRAGDFVLGLTAYEIKTVRVRFDEP